MLQTAYVIFWSLVIAAVAGAFIGVLMLWAGWLIHAVATQTLAIFPGWILAGTAALFASFFLACFVGRLIKRKDQQR